MRQTSLHDSLKAIARLDLTRVRQKASQRHGWDAARAQRAEQSYRRYLCLLAENPSNAIVPWSEDLDKMWHEHILDTRQYPKDCEAIFGRYIHHDPHISGRPEDHQRATLFTRRQYQRRFIRHEHPEHHGNLFSRMFHRNDDREIDGLLDALDVLDFDDWTAPAVMSIVSSYNDSHGIQIDSPSFNDASLGINSDRVCIDANMDGVCDTDAGGSQSSSGGLGGYDSTSADTDSSAGDSHSSCGGSSDSAGSSCGSGGGDGGSSCGGGGCGGGGD